MKQNNLQIRKPDDCHLHVRDDQIMKTVVPHTAKQFARAIIMPNLNPPIMHTSNAIAYRNRILNVSSKNSEIIFEPLMTLYLTENTSIQEICKAKDKEIIGLKLYPMFSTTNSNAGIKNIRKCYPIFEEMQKLDMPLLVHGESVDTDIDIFDREIVFIDRILDPLRKMFPGLRIVFEHITTKQAVQYIFEADTKKHGKIGATITPQHLLYNRNILFQKGLQPHYYCLPIFKREEDKQALIQAAISGNPRFFLGTDSAPHLRNQKESECGCAGCYTAFHALELYATVFDSVNALDKLEAFASVYGAEFYSLPLNKGTINLSRQSKQIPKSLKSEAGEIIPIKNGEILPWKVL